MVVTLFYWLWIFIYGPCQTFTLKGQSNTGFLLLNLCRTTFSEFAMKHGRDPRFKAIDKMKDREAIFIEFMTAMRKRDKEDSKTRGEKVTLT